MMTARTRHAAGRHLSAIEQGQLGGRPDGTNAYFTIVKLSVWVEDFWPAVFVAVIATV
jgi:hypothetical protein